MFLVSIAVQLIKWRLSYFNTVKSKNLLPVLDLLDLFNNVVIVDRFGEKVAEQFDYLDISVSQSRAQPSSVIGHLQAIHMNPYIMNSFANPISREVSPARFPASRTSSTCALRTCIYCLNVLVNVVESTAPSSNARRLCESKRDKASASSRHCDIP